MKHKLKGWARELWSRGLYHTGLWRLVDRMMPRRLLIMAGHCVTDPVNDSLPQDMKIEGKRLEQVLRVLGSRFELTTIGDGLAAIDGGGEGRSLVALSMDDGYTDNHEAMLPLLERAGAKCTVFLEARVFTERRLNWSHKWFWLLDKLGAEAATRQYVAELESPELLERFRKLLEELPADLAYQAKRILKYEARPADRDPALDKLFAERGGDERELCEKIYMDWSDVHALAESGRIEFGGHTIHHHVLSTLTPEEQVEEVHGGKALLATELGDRANVSFAYPFGRRWDVDDTAIEAVRSAGFRGAVTTHSGVVGEKTDRMRLPRWMIDDDTPIHHLVTEACGGFELMQRVGVDLRPS